MFFRGRYLVTGLVQGVGFRYTTLHRARSIGVTGYVHNLPDGSVEVIAEGNSGQLDVLEAFLREGPTHARVDALSIHRQDTENREYRDFSIR